MAKQSFRLYKKTKENQSVRTFLLDLIRNKLTSDFKQEFQFVVNHLKLSGDYAWFMGVAERKDGKEIQMPPEEMYDCCHVEVLYQKQNGKWQVVEYQHLAWMSGMKISINVIPKQILIYLNSVYLG